MLLGALVVYPIVYSVYRSFFDQAGTGFAGIDNYRTLFSDDTIRTAVKNNAIWVVFAPTVATALGLIFAVLTERVRWGTAFKLIVFMPMAISMLAAGIIFRLVYDQRRSAGWPTRSGWACTTRSPSPRASRRRIRCPCTR